MTDMGGVASPLLTNIYMNRFLKHWRQSGCGEAFRAHVVSYADGVMTRLGLKTSLRDARQERFTFLAYSFGPHWFKGNGKRYLGASPSTKSVQRLKTTVGNLLVARQQRTVARSARQVESVPTGLVELLPLRNAPVRIPRC